MKEEPYKLYKAMHESGIPGFSHVYIITLLHFFTNGRVPIYDRFASQALTAYEENLQLGSKITYVPLSQGIERSWCEYTEYAKRLKSIFGEVYTKRAIDRSMWVYGHYFKNTTAVEKCK